MSRTHRRSRVSRAPWFETLEARQLLHQGPTTLWPRVEEAILALVQADRAGRQTNGHPLSGSAAAVHAERAGLRSQMVAVRKE